MNSQIQAMVADQGLKAGGDQGRCKWVMAMDQSRSGWYAYSE